MGRHFPREGEVVQPGDAGYGGVNAAVVQTAFTKDLPCLNPREGVLDASPDLAVGGAVLLLQSRQLLLSRQFGLAAFTAVRDEQGGAPRAAVRDGRGPADGRPSHRKVPTPCDRCGCL